MDQGYNNSKLIKIKEVMHFNKKHYLHLYGGIMKI